MGQHASVGENQAGLVCLLSEMACHGGDGLLVLVHPPESEVDMEEYSHASSSCYLRHQRTLGHRERKLVYSKWWWRDQCDRMRVLEQWGNTYELSVSRLASLKYRK